MKHLLVIATYVLGAIAAMGLVASIVTGNSMYFAVGFCAILGACLSSIARYWWYGEGFISHD